MDVVESVNDKIHDDLIAHDVTVRRIDGACRRNAEARLDKLSLDLKALTIKIDPFGTDRLDARQRRVAKLEKEARIITAEAFADIARKNKEDLKRIARIESEVSATVIEDNLP